MANNEDRSSSNNNKYEDRSISDYDPTTGQYFSNSNHKKNDDRSNSNHGYQSGQHFPLPFHLQQSSSSSAGQQYPKTYIQPQYNTPPIQFPSQAVKPPSALSAGYSGSVPGAGMYVLPQFQQAQQLFQRDAQTITPEALESVKAALASSEIEHKAETKKRALPRKAAGQTWEDPTLAEWPENDYRLFCGDLGNEVNDEILSQSFSRFPDFKMARVVRDKRTGKTRGYGFVSFSTPSDLAGALKEMNGKYVGNRPIKLRKSTWRERTDSDALERQKYQTHKKPKVSKRSVLHK